tara:strand:- start:124 stop:240 length:117 start_codon:yes stop_codon:yes gene_type:complete
MTFQEAAELLTKIIIGEKKKVAIKPKRKVKRAVRKKRK